jgi:hypothetical protein
MFTFVAVTLVGSALGWGDYYLRSFVRGATWWAMERLPDDGLRILGEAEEVHPGLLAHLAGFDALVAHVRAHGPIDPSSAVGREILGGAGFEVRAAQSS